MADMPTPFRALTLLYLDTYATRVSHVYVTLRHKLIALGHFWRFLAEQYPEITTSADVAPAHGRAYIPYAIARARERQRGQIVCSKWSHRVCRVRPGHATRADRNAAHPSCVCRRSPTEVVKRSMRACRSLRSSTPSSSGTNPASAS
jgi:hypothetical protein